MASNSDLISTRRHQLVEIVPPYSLRFPPPLQLISNQSHGLNGFGGSSALFTGENAPLAETSKTSIFNSVRSIPVSKRAGRGNGH
jgi:hypothetical protein